MASLVDPVTEPSLMQQVVKNALKAQAAGYYAPLRPVLIIGHGELFGVQSAIIGGIRETITERTSESIQAMVRRVNQLEYRLTSQTSEGRLSVRELLRIAPHLVNPFRAPHNSISQQGLLGRKPGWAGEYQLAYQGVLLIDDIQDWRPITLKMLKKLMQVEPLGVRLIGTVYPDRNDLAHVLPAVQHYIADFCREFDPLVIDLVGVDVDWLLQGTVVWTGKRPPKKKFKTTIEKPVVMFDDEEA